MALRTNDQYKNIYLRSAEGHTDRLIRLNFQLTREFRLTGSGRLVARDQDTGATPPHSRTRNTAGDRNIQGSANEDTH